MPANRKSDKLPKPVGKRQNLAAKSGLNKTATRREGYVRSIVPKTIARTRSDIATWKSALRAADSVERPRRARLVNLLEDILLDAHLTSQLELRKQHVLSTPYVLKRNGEIAAEETALLMSAEWVTRINRHMLEVGDFGHSLIELTTDEQAGLAVTLIPRQNVIPEQGVLLRREDDENGIKYRELREYGTWLLEFGQPHDYGLLNKAVPHALFKRFAQSCWSELCEIYGIPPRYIKTDTQDDEMLDRAEAMLRDMGSAAYFIIDNTEEFQFAKGADTNGDVYSNLIRLCNNEMSMLIIGAVLGQDTKNGNESKEESSMKLLDKLVMADRKVLAGNWNTKILPAIERIGIFPPGLTFEFQQEEDLEKLWSMVRDLLPYKDVPNEWIKNKFGIEVTDRAPAPMFSQNRLSARDFFDMAP